MVGECVSVVSVSVVGECVSVVCEWVGVSIKMHMCLCFTKMSSSILTAHLTQFLHME